jgi:hypothetical protein
MTSMCAIGKSGKDQSVPQHIGWPAGYVPHPRTGEGGAVQRVSRGRKSGAEGMWLRRVAGAVVRLIYLQARARTNARDALWDLRAEIADHVVRGTEPSVH